LAEQAAGTAGLTIAGEPVPPRNSGLLLPGLVKGTPLVSVKPEPV
jgi:hypothetical protein